MKLFILLPSYNEEKDLPNLLESFKNLFEKIDIEYEVVVINDGSDDGTEYAAKQWIDKLNIKIINHNMNLGLGVAVNTGLTFFQKSCKDDDIAIIMDADNTHNPQLIISMLKSIKNGSEVVIASRYEKGGSEIGLTFFRHFCSLCINLLLSIIFGVPGVQDYTCGYRAYSAETISRGYKLYGNNFIEEKGFTCMAEIIIKLHFAGCKISEIPLVLRYDQKSGKSKMKIVSTIKRYFILIKNLRHYRQQLIIKPLVMNGKEK